LAHPSGHPEQRGWTVVTTKITTKQQVGPARKAAKMKAAADAKRPQPHWLQPRSLAPMRDAEPPLPPERVSAANRSQGPPRLLSKADILTITNVTFPTIWAWMRAGKFPRSRIVGGKSMWLSSEIDAWMASLPRRHLKGDAEVPEGGAA
jgi:predicted DNA-binding transcriptional regulator AlpA